MKAGKACIRSNLNVQKVRLVNSKKFNEVKSSLEKGALNTKKRNQNYQITFVEGGARFIG